MARRDVRSAIIDAAETLAVEKGFVGVTTKEVAKAADCSEGRIYNHFDDRSDLLAHVVANRMLAVMAAALKPAQTPPPEADRETLAALIRRRDQLVAMRAMERTRASEAGDAFTRADAEAHLDWLDQRISGLDRLIREAVRASASLSLQASLLRTAPGVGPVAAHVLMALLPELGQRSPKTIAALVGLAPLNADSGQKRGQRLIRGGRKRVRDALYMAALAAIRCNAAFADFYTRLRAAGKPAKVALIAVARKLLTKLNAMIRDKARFT
jgi:transposase